MKYVDALKKILKEQAGVGIGERWIRDWLILSSLNRAMCVPLNNPFTQVTALRVLFEYPYLAICQVLGDERLVSYVPFVALSDTGYTRILILDTNGGRCVASFKHRAWEFRWKTIAGLEAWMEAIAAAIMEGTAILEEQHGPDHGKHPGRKGAPGKAARRRK